METVALKFRGALKKLSYIFIQLVLVRSPDGPFFLSPETKSSNQEQSSFLISSLDMGY